MLPAACPAWQAEAGQGKARNKIGGQGNGAAAIEQLLTILPRGRPISWIFKIPFVRVVAEKLYRWFARNRYKLGCGEHCQYRPLDLDYHDAAD